MDLPWDFYVQGGVVSLSSTGILEERLRTGWAVEGGLRYRLPIFNDPVFPFLDVGCTYADNEGTGALVLANGTLTGSCGCIHTLSNFYQTTLSDLQRASLHLALGATWFPPNLNKENPHKFHFGFRVGARAGFFSAEYRQGPTPALQSVIDLETLDEDPRSFNYATNALRPGYTRGSGFLYGAFASGGAGWTWCDVHLAGRPLGDVTAGAEVEFTRDWLDLGSFVGGNHTLASVIPMLTLSFSF